MADQGPTQEVGLEEADGSRGQGDRRERRRLEEALREAGHRPAPQRLLAAGVGLRAVGCAAQVQRASDFTCLKYSGGRGLSRDQTAVVAGDE